jgi:hypothetical protein
MPIYFWLVYSIMLFLWQPTLYTMKPKLLLLAVSALFSLSAFAANNIPLPTPQPNLSNALAKDTLAANFTVETDRYFSPDKTCYKLNVRVYEHSNGQKTLIRSADICTGTTCDNTGMVTNDVVGDYKGDFIIKDYLVQGKTATIKSLFDSNKYVYTLYLLERIKITGE